MISIRESTFETNSSSCHSLTICDKDLMEKLKNYDLIYIGNFEYADDCGLYKNVLDSREVVDRNQFMEALTKFRDETLEEVEDWDLKRKDWLKQHPEIFEMSLQELSKAKFDYYDFQDIAEWALRSLYKSGKGSGTYTDPGTMFGGEDTYIVMEKEFLDPDTKKPVKVLLTNIGC